MSERINGSSSGLLFGADHEMRSVDDRSFDEDDDLDLIWKHRERQETSTLTIL